MELQPDTNNEDHHLSPSVSSLSHSNSTADKKKRTRDLPNLTQCHSCGFRIDSCSGNDFLQILYSEWRIVLLCHDCFVSVESPSILCSYCFKSGSPHDDDCFTCPQCKRIIHKSCFSSHSNVAPWSFCSSPTTTSSTARFSVCLDCWVPKLGVRKRGYCGSKRKNLSVFELGDSRKRLLKNVVRDVNFEAATRARELAVEKVVGARRTTALGGDNAVSGVDDVELNRFSKNFCSLNTHCLAVPNQLLTNGFPQSSVLVRVSDYDSSMNLDESNRNGNMKGGCSNKYFNSTSQSCKGGDGSVVPAGESYEGATTRYFIKYSRKVSANVLGDGKPDRYRIKYTRRALAHETYNSKTNRYLIKYARRKSAYQRYKGKPSRFAIRYTRRKLNQRPILDIPTRRCPTDDASMRKNIFESYQL